MFSKKIKNKNKINKNNNNSLTYSLAKGMTVPELRNELKLRGLSTSGKKATLVHRVKYYATRHPDLLDLKNKKRNYNTIKDSNNDDEINETPQKKRKIDNNNKNNSNNNDDDYKESEPEVPDDFLCPITYDIMKEPYISFHSGRSFEKTAIINHVRLNGNDPITRQAITTKDLIPNRNLKSLIQKWVEQNNYKMDDTDDDDDDEDDDDDAQSIGFNILNANAESIQTNNNIINGNSESSILDKHIEFINSNWFYIFIAFILGILASLCIVSIIWLVYNKSRKYINSKSFKYHRIIRSDTGSSVTVTEISDNNNT